MDFDKQLDFERKLHDGELPTNKSGQFDLRVTTTPNAFTNKDCMEDLVRCPSNYFDLAIVDPPYGIDINKSGRLVKEKGWQYKEWDKQPPTEEYFKELMRVSKNQIIWGANYFLGYLPPTKCFVIWDKIQPEDISFASCEFAWTSFKDTAKTYRDRPQNMDNGNRVHPTQKPINLYRFLLKQFAKEGDLILDTHVGSASSLIACIELGYDYVGYEIDREYYQIAQKRIAGAYRKFELFD